MFCTYCGEQFSRKEHLERHILTHTNIRPFRCGICHASFNRKDLLRRHYTLIHKDPEDNGGTHSFPDANRTSVACTNCARSKTKCNNTIPCARCSKRGLVCEARQSRRWNEPAKRPRTASKSSSERSNIPTPESQPPQRSPHTRVESELSRAQEELRLTDGTDIEDSTPSSRSLSVPEIRGNVHEFGFNHGGQLPAPHTSLDIGTFPLQPTEWFSNSYDRMMYSSDPSDYTMDFSMQDPSVVNPEAAYAQSGVSTPSIEYGPTNPAYFHPDAASFPFPSKTIMHSVEGSPAAAGPARVSQPIAAEQNSGRHQLSWPCFQCNPSSDESAAPQKPRDFLMALRNHLQDPYVWESRKSESLPMNAPSESRPVQVVPLTCNARDRLVVLVQSILYQSLDGSTSANIQHQRVTKSRFLPFVMLPSSQILDQFLEVACTRHGANYGLTSARPFDPSKLLQQQDNEDMAGLLILLIIAQGAQYTDTWEAQTLSSGLAEVCRIIVQEYTDQDDDTPTSQTVLHYSALLLELTAWSGHRWQMSAGLTLWDSITNLLKQSNYFEARLSLPSHESIRDTEEAFRVWQERQGRSTLIYAWVAADLDMSLFYDAPPKISANELYISFPQTDVLWRCRTTAEWDGAYGPPYFATQQSSKTPPLSLRSILRKLVDRNILAHEHDYTPAELRLLLQPIQTVASHLYQCLSPIFHSGSGPGISVFTTTLASKAFLDEVTGLLHQWWALTTRSISRSSVMCANTVRNLITYHLMYLNNLIYFPEVERLARQEPTGGAFHRHTSLRLGSAEDTAQILFHCGQVLRHLRRLPETDLPIWWPAALYRVALVLWTVAMADSMGCNTLTISHGLGHAQDAFISLDTLDANDETLLNFAKNLEGIPILTTREGNPVSLKDPAVVLGHSIRCLSENGTATPLAHEIKRKLDQMRQRWSG